MPATGSQDMVEELSSFLRSHKVISVQKTLEAIEGAPGWCFCVEYLDRRLAVHARQDVSAQHGR